MIKKHLYLLFMFICFSCGYPDIDDVPDFKDVNLNDEEISDYCNNMYSDKKNIDKCINDNKK